MSTVVTESDRPRDHRDDHPTAEQAADGAGLREGAFGNATALVVPRVRPPGRPRARTTPVRSASGPLEIAYEFPEVTREEIEAGPGNIWRYKALLPVPTDIEQSPNMEPGFTRLLRRDNLGRRWASTTLWVKDDSTNPTNSFKDRVVACALSAAREFGSKVFACPSTGNLANAVAAAGARAGMKTVVFIPSNLEQPKQVNSAVYTDSLVAVERQLRRREQAGLGDRGRGGRLGVRQRQRPALLRRGLQDAGLRDRRAARLAAARPGRHPGRLAARS